MPENTPPEAVSVIVPAHGPLPFLEEALAPLLEQAGADDEIILVDNHAERDLTALTDDPRVRVVVARDRASAGYARNAGVQAARHERLIFCDADDRAGEGYLDAMREALAGHDLVAAAESFGLLNHGPSARAADAGPIWYWHGDHEWPFVGSCAFGCSRSSYVAVGGFDERIPALEDIDLSFRMHLAGFAIHPVPDVVMHIRHRGDVRTEHRRQRSHGRASVWLESRYARYGMPAESKLRNAAGWVRCLLKLVFRRDPDESWVLAGWKSGRWQGAADIRRGRDPEQLDLMSRPSA